MDVFSYELGKKSGGGSGGGIQYVEIQMGATPILNVHLPNSMLG